MKIGVRAHDYGKMEIEAMANTLREEGYQGAQLALPKAFTGIDSYGDITPEHLERIQKAFSENHIEIPVLGCYMDLGNPDKDVRTFAVATLKKCLSYAKTIGASMVGTETAYPRLTAEEKKAWFPYALDSTLRVLEEAQRLDVPFALEPVYWHPLESLEAVLNILDKAGDSVHLRLIFDASNLLEFPETTNQPQYWKTWLEGIGTWVDAMHIKDFTLDEGRNYCPSLLGDGVIDYTYIAQWLHTNKPDIFLLREEMNPKFAAKEIDFLKNL